MRAPLILNYIRLTLLALLVNTTVVKVRAQGIITIPTPFFHADPVKKIIVVNTPIRQLNKTGAASDSIRAFVANGHEYVLTHAAAHLSTAASYRVTSNASTYTVYFTQVPVLRLSTHHQIADAPSVYANLVLTDTTGIIAQSAIGIEFRGAFSQSYPKKSYELSLWADTLGTNTQDLSLLGMRSDNKWNLQAMYNDQLRLRVKVANELWQDIHQIYYHAQEPKAKNGIDLAYTEVFINDSYQGIYTLTERIDRKQLKLKKYDNGIKGELYKETYYSSPTAFASMSAFDNTSLTWEGFEYKEPTEEINWSNLSGFVSFVVNSSDAAFYSQYQSRFNLANAVDYYLFLNLMRATDNTAKNLYIAKYKANEPYYFAPWDLDGVLGNDWSGTNVNTTNDILTNGFYSRLVKDYSANGFQATLASRWTSLRTSVITNAYINAKINANNTYLLANNVYEREHLAWPDYHYDAAQLTYPAGWLASRLTYLDSVFKPANAALGAAGPASSSLHVYPNPASEYLYVDMPAWPAQLAIRDMSGHTLLQATLTARNSRLSISSLPKGVYLASLKSSTTTTVQKLVIE